MLEGLLYHLHTNNNTKKEPGNQPDSFALKVLFSRKGAAFGFAAAAGSVAANFHLFGNTAVCIVVRALHGTTLDIGVFLGLGFTYNRVFKAVYSVVKAVAEGVTAFLGIVAVNLNDGAAAKAVFVVDAVANGAF